MKRNQSIVIVLLSVFVAVGSVSFAVKTSSRTKAVESENADLRRQLADLQKRPEQPEPKQVAESTQSPKPTNTVVALKVPTNSAAANPEPAAKASPRREGFAEHMARMKKENPERYAEWVKRRSEFHETMKYNLAERTATFMDLDTSRMSDEERASHDQLVNRMGKIWELMEQMGNPEEMNREAMHEMFRTVQEVAPLLEQERSTMLRILGEDLGYTGQDAQVFADHVDDIISATSMGMPPGMGRGRGRR